MRKTLRVNLDKCKVNYYVLSVCKWGRMYVRLKWLTLEEGELFKVPGVASGSDWRM